MVLNFNFSILLGMIEICISDHYSAMFYCKPIVSCKTVINIQSLKLLTW